VQEKIEKGVIYAIVVPAMGRPKKPNAMEVLNVRLPPNLGRILKERAALLGKPPSTYLREIVENWEAGGCPPVSYSDEAVVMRLSAEMGKRGEKSAAQAHRATKKKSHKLELSEDREGNVRLPGGIVAPTNPDDRRSAS
jgi:hypothetical protein